MKRVLFFTYDFPYPTDSGGKNRAYNLMKFAKSSDVELFLFSFTRPGFDKSNIRYIEEIGVTNIKTFERRKLMSPGTLMRAASHFNSIFKTLYHDSKIHQALLDYVRENKIDVVHFESIYTSYYISASLEKLGVRQIFGTENIEYKLYQDYVDNNISKFKRPFFRRQVGLIEKEERSMAKNADAVLCVTYGEKKYFDEISGKDSYIIENGIDTSHFSYKDKKSVGKKSILFVGNFAYFPNVDAIRVFYQGVFPHLDATLVVLGKHQDKLPFIKNDSRVIQIEYVQDIRDVYYNADVFVSPVKIGGGTNFKIIEAAACGVPIVAITSRAEDLEMKDGEHFLGANGVESFIVQTKKALAHDSSISKMTKNARNLIEKKYEWSHIGRRLHDVWINI